jgi:hypothetical protein
MRLMYHLLVQYQHRLWRDATRGDGKHFTENRFRNFAVNRSSQAISQSDHGIWLLEVIAVRRLAMACLPCMRVEHQERGFQAVHDLTS